MSNFVKVGESYINPESIAWASPMSGGFGGLVLHYVYSTHGRPYVESVSNEDAACILETLANVKGMLRLPNGSLVNMNNIAKVSFSKQTPYNPTFVAKFGPGMSFGKPNDEPIAELVAQVRFLMTTVKADASEPVLHTFRGVDAEALKAAFDGLDVRVAGEQGTNPRPPKREAVKCG